MPDTLWRHYNVNNVIPTKVGIQSMGEVHSANSLDPHFRGDDKTFDFFTTSPCQLNAAMASVSDRSQTRRGGNV
jgi:hypothetical protein